MQKEISTVIKLEENTIFLIPDNYIMMKYIFK